MEQKTNKKNTAIIIALVVAILLSVIVLTVAIVSMMNDGGSKKEDEAPVYTRAEIETITEESKTPIEDIFSNDEAQSDVQAPQSVVQQPTTDKDGFIDVEAGDVQTPETTKKYDNSYNPVKEYEELSKNGENKLSDHHNNKYIKLVAEKYDVDTELLVAVYSEPDTGNNFVLEFNGKRDEDGNVIKSPDTLAKVYQIDKNKKISIATGKTTGNVGVSYAEGTLCFHMVKSLIMPQYPDYFTGVEK